MTANGRRLIVGIGSPFADDLAGWLVVDRLRELLPPPISPHRTDTSPESTAQGTTPDTIVRRARVPLDVLDWLHDIQQLHLVDAATGTVASGVQRISWPTEQLATATTVPQLALSLRRSAGHDFDITDVLKLAAVTGRLPQEVVLWAVGAWRFDQTDSVSAETRQGVDKCVRQLRQELAGQGSTAPP
jgi:Ni,Fe-hydrogenase maturation factor